MQITNLPAAEGNNATQTALLVMLSTPVEIVFETFFFSYATTRTVQRRAACLFAAQVISKRETLKNRYFHYTLTYISMVWSLE